MSKQGAFKLLIPGCILIVLVLLCCFACIFFYSIVAGSTPNNNIDETVLEQTSSSDKIAVIDIAGMIASTPDTAPGGKNDMVDMILTKLHKAEKDENVKAIILRLDTPGGTVYDSDQIAQEVKRIDQKKPIIAFMESSATSGGYYISAPTRKIVASDTTVTGSIGVILQTVNLDGLYEKIGVKTITITNTQGNVKALQHIDDPNSEDHKILERILDDHFEGFVNIIMEGRGMTREQVLSFANGSIYSGKRAKKLGLVDELGNFDTAVQVAKNEAGISDADVVVYETYTSPFSNLSFKYFSKIAPISSINNKLKTEPGVYYYYLAE